jgi:two-component system nitrogen regulation sensor histidine kinase NtrY
VRNAVVLRQAGSPDVVITNRMPEGPILAFVDPTLIAQALTNLLKNACEAIEARQENDDQPMISGEVRVLVEHGDDRVAIRIQDNGTGLPPQRARLFEPYVTTRAKGTGLGLSIVRKIAEDHAGSLTLDDAPPFAEGARPGAEAVLTLPLRLPPSGGAADEADSDSRGDAAA